MTIPAQRPRPMRFTRSEVPTWPGALEEMRRLKDDGWRVYSVVRYGVAWEVCADRER